MLVPPASYMSLPLFLLCVCLYLVVHWQGCAKLFMYVWACICCVIPAIVAFQYACLSPPLTVWIHCFYYFIIVVTAGAVVGCGVFTILYDSPAKVSSWSCMTLLLWNVDSRIELNGTHSPEKFCFNKISFGHQMILLAKTDERFSLNWFLAPHLSWVTSPPHSLA